MIREAAISPIAFKLKDLLTAAPMNDGKWLARYCIYNLESGNAVKI
jgi:hypothetical protein